MSDLAKLSITKKVISWSFILLITFGGIWAYNNLGRLEDPEFTIKEAIVKTDYPGATPREVEQEVTDKLEKAAQQLPQIKRVVSLSMAGYSEINVVIKDKYDKSTLPQVWDELRRKINDAQPKLPKGAHTSQVNDDFGDVYGMYYAITGDGYDYRELKDYSEYLEKQLLLVPGVAKVAINGLQKENIFVEIARSKIAQLGISTEAIYNTLREQNLVSNSGQVRVGDEYIRIQPSGAIDSVATISNLLIYSPKTKRLIHLDSIASVKRGFEEVPKALVYFDGKPALTIGISIVSGGNIVKIGKAVQDKIHYMMQNIPIGVELHAIYDQPRYVKNSVNSFVISVLEALAIVVVCMLLSMGLRSGIVIGVVLLLTVFATLLVMKLCGIQLERISLGALIIALGMMVDNAIVIVEGILIKTKQGISVLKAASETVKQTQWALFGSTLVGILAFSAIGLSKDSTGEYTRSLFYVIFISLMFSWILAITVAPLFCEWLLKKEAKKSAEGNQTVLYNGLLYRGYRGFLTSCIRHKYITIIVMIALLVLSLFGFTKLKPGFFPDSTTPLFLVNYWKAQGTDLRATAHEMQLIQQHIKNIKGVEKVASIVGAGALRFSLVYTPEKSNASYGQFLVVVNDYHEIDQISAQVKQYIEKKFPDSQPTVDKIRLGPGSGAKIEARVMGPDPTKLREIATQVTDIMHNNPQAIDIRDDWRHRVKILKPMYADSRARQTGISRAEMSDALQSAFGGKVVGVYREGDTLIPIVSRLPDQERLNISNINDISVWSQLLDKSIPIGQLVTSFKTIWQDAIVRRRNRMLTLTVSCNPDTIQAGTLFKQLQPKIESLKLPSGYHIEWGGEYESSHDAQVALFSKIPMTVILMVFIIILMFNRVRQPLIIWLCVPLALIGVVAGLLITNNAFEFMAMLGFLSLTGMLIKNAVVLLEQIDLEIKIQPNRMQAVIDASLSRARPVILAALTTVLGMAPLLFDAFFSSMAVTIMFGLSFATVLTLVVVPVLYVIFFRIKLSESKTCSVQHQ
ncbi:MAG: efflux RND transporter permease subunit [Coxiellaceae bacterium]|nr:efflux RND transporter permease subunit [Coxiellaceae bacterium]